MRITRAPQTWRNYRWALEQHILPDLGARPLDALRRADLQRLAEQLLLRLGPRSVRLVLTIARALLSSAVDHELVAVNPAARPAHTLRVPPGPARPAFTPTTTRRLLTVAARDDPALYPLFLFLARTGVRLGEALGLTWEAVDLTERIALIHQQPWTRGVVTATKNGRAHMVDLSAQLTLVLRNRCSATNGPWVFPGPTGYPWHRSTVLRHLRALLGHAGLPQTLSPHAFRHGFASTLLRRGEPLAYVQRALNHADPKLTVSLYGCHLPNSRLSAVDGLDDLG